MYTYYKSCKYAFIALHALCSDPDSLYVKYKRLNNVHEDIDHYFWLLREQWKTFIHGSNHMYRLDFREFSASRILLLCEIFEMARALINEELAWAEAHAGAEAPRWAARRLWKDYADDLKPIWNNMEMLLPVIRGVAAEKEADAFLEVADIARVETVVRQCGECDLDN